MTQGELANKVVAPHSLISYFENGHRVPSKDLMEAIASTLGFEPDFFYEPLVEEFKVQQCNFRHLTGTSEALKKRILAHCSLLTNIIRYLKKFVDLPAYDIPKISVGNYHDIKQAAIYCRQEWSLTANGPIDNMVRVLENHGVITHRHTTATNDIDAFSRYGDVTLVILNDYKQSASRSFWDAAHELGHLVMHIDSDKDIRQREKEANAFAAEFLLPQAGFTRDFGIRNKIDWSNLFDLKQQWKTSVAALVHRAYDLKLIEAVEYRKAFKSLRYKGWHKGEPHELTIEQSELLPLIFEQLENESNISPGDVADQLYFHHDTFEEIIGIHITEKNGGGVPITKLNDYRSS
jgi:Zn-dependent peptidase ImmA (M78 family)/transcriptional regulator with XRE-family HTH domain